jgi:hypothetical protein
MANTEDLKQAQLATTQAINRHSMTLLGMWLLALVLLGLRGKQGPFHARQQLPTG